MIMAADVIDLCSSDDEEVAPVVSTPLPSATFRTGLDAVLLKLSGSDKPERQRNIDELLIIFEVYIRNLINFPDVDR